MTYYFKLFLHYIHQLITVAHNDIVYQRYRQKYEIDPSFRFNGSGIIFHGDGQIKIGKESYIGIDSAIQSRSGCKVVIGDRCAISHNVKIYTSNYDADEIIRNHTKNLTKEGDVIIGDNCWIGVNVLITEGVHIGSNVVIGGNSVVTKSFPSNCVIGGVPAKIIKVQE